MIARAAALLRLLSAHPEGVSQTALGEILGLPRSTVGRTLSALRAEGLVSPIGGRGPYRLGAEIPRMAQATRRATALDLHPAIHELSRRLGETVELYSFDQSELTLVDHVAADRRLRVVGRVGEAVPLHCSAAGKALLGSLPPSHRKRLLPRRLRPLTAVTNVNRAAVLAEVANLGVGGLAFEREEQLDGVCGIAAVLESTTEHVLVCNLAVPTARFVEREDELADELLRWCTAVTLGGERETTAPHR